MIPGCEQVFGGRQEWRVEAAKPDSKIWGIEFNQPAEEIQPELLIECGTCRNTAYTTLTSIEDGFLLSVGMISHQCNLCGQTTRWKPTVQAPVAAGSERIVKSVASGAETRKLRRLELAMRVHV